MPPKTQIKMGAMLRIDASRVETVLQDLQGRLGTLERTAGGAKSGPGGAADLLDNLLADVIDRVAVVEDRVTLVQAMSQGVPMAEMGLENDADADDGEADAAAAAAQEGAGASDGRPPSSPRSGIAAFLDARSDGERLEILHRKLVQLEVNLGRQDSHMGQKEQIKAARDMAQDERLSMELVRLQSQIAVLPRSEDLQLHSKAQTTMFAALEADVRLSVEAKATQVRVSVLPRPVPPRPAPPRPAHPPPGSSTTRSTPNSRRWSGL